MKKIMIYLLMVVFSLPALAQRDNNLFAQLTNAYSDQEGFSASMITKDMFDLYLKKKNVDSESSAFDAIKNLDKIVVVSQSNLNQSYTLFAEAEDKPKKEDKNSLSEGLYQTILNHYKNGDYTLLKTEKRMGEEVKVYLKKNQDKIESLAVLTHSNANTGLIELQGNINLTAVADLNKALNLRGLENLYKINNNNGAAVYFGQNSNVYFPQERIEQMVARQKELIEKQQYFSDEQRAKIEEQARVQAERQMEMAEKYREMAERYQRQPVFLNYPGDSTEYFLNGKKVDADEIKQLDKTDIVTIDVKANKDEDITTIQIRTK
ncbi:DUF4252 domain-containing protein [Maribellus maritimus]|uniref:DUF4252 domain-containing protein n=1 Tax=Maribellus maritimus TaxID=2870838 RepID=UPI001EEAF280|nr:DUF4252 domain-containing protein [Maribellus maritimus]MCG6188182.1 DUF4252 domain-containing protein [Maribellus maritimus]